MNIRLLRHISHFRAVPVFCVLASRILLCVWMRAQLVCSRITCTVHFAVIKVMSTLTLWWRSQSQLASKDSMWASHFLNLNVFMIIMRICSLILEKLFWIFQLKGMLRVILEPLIGDAPLVGGVTFFFLRRPASAHRRFHDLTVTNQTVQWATFNTFFFLDPRNQLDRSNQPFGHPCLQVSFHRKKPLPVSVFSYWSTQSFLHFTCPPFQLAVRGHHHGHHCFTHGVAKPYVRAPHRPGQSGPDEIPTTSCM